MSIDSSKDVRIDKWLWATRVYKTRSLATDACKRGRVTINNMNVKSSRPVRVGEVVNVRKSPVTFSFRVLALLENRVGAKLVSNYSENITPKSQYDILEMSRINNFIDRVKGSGRPTKKEGRDMARFAEDYYDTIIEDLDDLDDFDEYAQD